MLFYITYTSISFSLVIINILFFPSFYWRTNPINLPEKCVVDHRVNHKCGALCDALNNHDALAKRIYYTLICHTPLCMYYITQVYIYIYIYIYLRYIVSFSLLYCTHRYIDLCTRILWAYYFPHRLFVDGFRYLLFWFKKKTFICFLI